MKRFEIAIEISKQLITLCSALIVGTAALASNILSNELSKTIITMLIIQYCLYFLSIIAGIFHIGAVANLIETAERNDFEKAKSKSTPSPSFISMFDSKLAPRLCLLQQVLFAAGVLLLVATVITDWNMEK